MDTRDKADDGHCTCGRCRKLGRIAYVLPPAGVRSAATPMQSIDRLHRMALLGLAVIAIITVVGAFALESATRWVMHPLVLQGQIGQVQNEMN